MKNDKLIAAQSFLETHGVHLTDVVVLELLDCIKDKASIAYDIGDFVSFNEGMGEMGHGQIVSMSGQIYKVQYWTHDPVAYPSHIHTVTHSDMRGLSTPNKAMGYYLDRSGQS